MMEALRFLCVRVPNQRWSRSQNKHLGHSFIQVGLSESLDIPLSGLRQLRPPLEFRSNLGPNVQKLEKAMAKPTSAIPSGSINDGSGVAVEPLSVTTTLSRPLVLSLPKRFGIRVDFQYGQAAATLQGNAVNEPRPSIYQNIFQAQDSLVWNVNYILGKEQPDVSFPEWRRKRLVFLAK